MNTAEMFKKYTDQLLVLVKELAEAHVKKQLEEFEKLISTTIQIAVDALPKAVDGKDGSDGKSVSAEELEPMLADMVSKAVDALPKAVDGKDGSDGKSVSAEELEPMLADMVSKAVDALPKAVDGKDGSDGRDAIMIEILPGIDIEKSYNRGTFALHKGGIWRSYEKTKGMKGWENVVNGIAEFKEEFDGERTLIRSCELSNGEKVETVIKLSVPIDRGFFKEGQEYLKGDGVSFGGSWWIANKDAPQGRPATSEDWELRVKRGRDGKEVVKIPKDNKDLRINVKPEQPKEE